MRWSSLVLILVVWVGLPPAVRAGEVKTHTWYDDDADEFRTRGHVDLALPLSTVTRVAAAFDGYRLWALRNINIKKNGDPFITQLRDVRFRSQKGTLGRFVVTYDLDLVWPFGSEGDQIVFAVKTRRAHPQGGIDRLVVGLGEESALLNHFHLELIATGNETRSRVSFYARVEILAVIDAFFSLGRYRENIEYRIVKVVQNLGVWLKTQRSVGPPN